MSHNYAWEYLEADFQNKNLLELNYWCFWWSPWKHISWSCRRKVIVLKLLLEEVWNSVVNVATEDRHIFTLFSTPRSRSMSLCGLPLHGWAFVAPRRFHLTALAITALTVARGRNLTYWLVGNVASCDSATLKVTELFCKAILLSMFVYGDCMTVCSIWLTCQQWVWLK
jgi:hypothetical protein